MPSKTACHVRGEMWTNKKGLKSEESDGMPYLVAISTSIIAMITGKMLITGTDQFAY